MSSDHSPHTAHLTIGDRHSWEVSWLPGRHLDRNTAITAMMLADVTGAVEVQVGHRLWPHVSGWAAELALAAPEALDQIAKPPSWAHIGRSGAMGDPGGS